MDLSGRKSFVFLPAEGERVNELFDDIQDVYRNRISLSFFLLLVLFLVLSLSHTQTPARAHTHTITVS